MTALSIPGFFLIPKSTFKWTEFERLQWEFDRVKQILCLLYVVLWSFSYFVKS